MSDVALRGFISQHISDHDYEIISELLTANKMYETLRDRHQKQGLFAKIKTIRTILDTVLPLHRTPFCQTFDDISRLHSRYIKVFVLVPRTEVPKGQQPLKGKLVCKRKRDDTGKVVRYKVRYVAKGFTQHYGIDYDKTTTPTIHLKSFRAILHLAATLDWDLKQFDIKTAFLHGILPEDKSMYMEQPPGFESPGKED